MAISFTRAPTVAAGDRVTSTQHALLSAAFNDRLRSGIADGDWRIAYYFKSLFEQIRNPDAFGNFPPRLEYFTKYQFIKPTEAQWPVSPAGEVEGANLNSISNTFVHGSEDTDLDPEVDRMGSIPLVGQGASDATIWENTKAQRGAIDIATGLVSSPSWDEARTPYYIRSYNQSPYGTSYGGYQPLFDLNGDCGDGDTDRQATPKYTILFTNLNDSSTVTYDSCTTAYVEGPEAYYVFTATGVTILPFSAWIEGPKDEGSKLTKRFGKHLPRVVNAWALTFRGTESQAGKPIGQRSPDWQDFFTHHYHLAPARGVTVNAEENIISDIYPNFRSTSPLSSGSFVPCESSGQSFWPVNSSFVVVSLCMFGTNLTGSVNVNILVDDVVVKTATMPADVSGKIVSLLDTPVLAGSDVKIRLASPLQFIGGSGEFRVELAETYDYKPGVHDAYLLTRLGACNPSADLTGTDFASAKDIGSTYFQKCGVVGINSTSLPAYEDATNQNALFETMRQMSLNVRFITREMVRKYAVENGKSILWFAPTVRVDGETFNPWEGIVGEIKHTAEPRGFTNEWLMRADFKVYQNSNDSIWKPDAYTDFFGLLERCQFYNKELFNLGKYDLVSHFNYGDKLSLAPEAPPGYRYAGGSNAGAFATADERTRFFKSCQVYEKPAEIESCEYDTDGLVKITFTRRLPYHPDAPSSISSDVGTWVRADIIGENYRTIENGLREYLYHRNYGVDCQREQIGDTHSGSELWTDYSNVRGACYPLFYFVKLIPSPYEDGNDRQNATDTKCVVDTFAMMETYIRAMCEGYIDGQTTLEKSCGLGTPSYFDYSFEALCFEAFGGRSFKFLPLEIREDRPTGFGPFPNTVMYAEIFNQFSAAINLLTSARVMLPLIVNWNTKQFEHEGTPLGSITEYHGPAIGPPGENDLIATTGPFSGSSVACSAYNGINVITYDRTYSHRDEQWFEVGDGGSNALLAIPEEWRDMIEDGTGLAILCERFFTVETLTHEADPSCADIVQTSVVSDTDCFIFNGPKLVPPDPPATLVTYQGSGVGAPCTEGNNSIVQLNFISDEVFALTVPLV